MGIAHSPMDMESESLSIAIAQNTVMINYELANLVFNGIIALCTVVVALCAVVTVIRSIRKDSHPSSRHKKRRRRKRR